MNNPDDMPIDHVEMVAWLSDHRRVKSLSWSALEKDSSIPSATLSAFMNGTYKGNVPNIARRVFQYRQKVESQNDRAREALTGPSYIETPTSRRVQLLLEWAQMGRMTLAAMGPGTGKTMTAEHYKASVGETVWLATMEQSTKSVSAMIAEVMRAMGIASKSGWVQQRSAQIIEHATGRRGLLIVDEANHLELSSLEQLRSWHDKAGLGIALLGNEELIMRIRGRGGSNRHAYARLNSRIAKYHLQDMPLEEDVAAYLDGMDIIEPDIRRVLRDVALSAGNGGLREVQQTLESAHMLSIADDQPLGIIHVRDALADRATEYLRRAA